jgi:NTE family protein
MPDITLVLGGGGIKGIAHIGVLHVLEKNGISIRAIAGTSAGGIVGALYAAGYSASQIEDLIRNVDQRALFRRSPEEGPALLGFSGLIETLSEPLGQLTFDDLPTPFACTAVDLNTAQEIILSSGNVLEAALATAAVPGVFPAREIGECTLVDGGVLDPVPVALGRWLASTLPVIAVCLSPSPEQWKHLPAIQLPTVPVMLPRPILQRITQTRFSQAFQIFIKSMDISARSMAELKLQIDRPDVLIRPDVSRYAMLDEVAPSDLIRIGEEAAWKALPQIEKALGWRSTISRRFRRPASPPGKILTPTTPTPTEPFVEEPPHDT